MTISWPHGHRQALGDIKALDVTVFYLPNSHLVKMAGPSMDLHAISFGLTTVILHIL